MARFCQRDFFETNIRHKRVSIRLPRKEKNKKKKQVFLVGQLEVFFPFFFFFFSDGCAGSFRHDEKSKQHRQSLLAG